MDPWFYQTNSRTNYLFALRLVDARINSFSSCSSMVSFSYRSIERDALASSPALKRPFGSSREAPLKKLYFRWSLNAPRAITFPLAVQTGVPHFHSSLSLESASLMSRRRSAIRRPRQSGRSAICLSICSEGVVISLFPPRLESLGYVVLLKA